MAPTPIFSYQKGSLRQRILASVGAMVLLSLLSSAVSLFRITEVSRSLEAINHVSVPLGRLFTQMQSDIEVFHREFERSLGYSHWKSSGWYPRPIPHWIEEVLENEMSRVSELLNTESEWATPEAKLQWQGWANQVAQELSHLKSEAARLYSVLNEKNQPRPEGLGEASASGIYLKWAAEISELKRQLHWGAAEYERSLRLNFATAEGRVAELRIGLEIILIIVVLMSLLLLWLGERALRPLADLTRLARDITRRGLRKEDKALLPIVPLSRSDEVSQLAIEFHHMATALLEREKTVESQKSRLQEQNRLLREIGSLNQNILNSIESVLIVSDLEGNVTKCNPGALTWLNGTEEEIMGSKLMSWPKLQQFLEDSPNGESWLDRIKKVPETWKMGPLSIRDRVFGGYLMPLKREQGEAHGAILVVDDLTEEVDLQERLRRAENLAAVGRMSAQVAHEVRNPLHSIGLEAEMAAEMAAKWGDSGLRQALQSILGSVDRLQKITENYLKLSRLSAGQKSVTDLGELLETVLATYSPVCEAQRVKVHWKCEPDARLKVWVDIDLLGQVLGNLMRNSLQALEGSQGSSQSSWPEISWSLGNTQNGDVWFRIQDNGPGIPCEIKDRLFTPFVTTRAQGTGLGLSFIKKVLEDHGGTIRVRESLWQGACFEGTIPEAGSREWNQVQQKELNHGENTAGG